MLSMVTWMFGKPQKDLKPYIVYPPYFQIAKQWISWKQRWFVMMTFQITSEINDWPTTNISLQINILQPYAILYKAQATCTFTMINNLYHVICLKKGFQMIGNGKHLLFHLKVLNILCSIIFHKQDGKLNPWSWFHPSRQQPQCCRQFIKTLYCKI